MVFLGQQDPFFPPDVILARARERLPNLSHSEVFDAKKHISSPNAQRRVAASIREFFRR